LNKAGFEFCKPFWRAFIFSFAVSVGINKKINLKKSRPFSVDQYSGHAFVLMLPRALRSFYSPARDGEVFSQIFLLTVPRSADNSSLP
jgi:hypothetical protein